jgi:glucosamine--fructose-6-phosphate aminotransferase (isomerizing)
MCGIVGYIGDKDITSVLLVGLERLSYRGYDSSGIAVISNEELSYWRRAGKLHELSKVLEGLSIKGSLGIGHTRWATHGVPDETNAHPQFSANRKIAVVHNGIIENFSTLKEELITKGFIFRSQTDTEVIVHLIDHYFDGDLYQAVKSTIKRIEGAYAIVVIAESHPNQFIVARKGSPLIIGIGKNENYVSSDINAITTHTKDLIFLDDNEIGIITKENVIIKNGTGNTITKKVTHIDWTPTKTEKEGYDHFMLKEIFEQPSVVRKILKKYVKNATIEFKHIQRSPVNYSEVNRFIIQACGTSWHAGLIAKYWIENMVSILTEVDVSSEFRYRNMIRQGTAIVMAVSQSGETADTLACLREAKSKFFKVLSFVNVKESAMDRESDSVIYSHSGQEIGVASTKNFSAQLVTLYLFSLYLSGLKKTLTTAEITDRLNELNRIPDYIDQLLNQSDVIKSIAEKYYLSRDFLFIGRGVNYPSALEGALKLKEISYIHATGYAAGELKHGPIALIDPKLPVVCIAPKTSTYDKMINNIQEVKSRKGKIIAIATEGDQKIGQLANDVIYIPKVQEALTPLLVAIPLQLLSYYIAIKLDCDVDQPRNLAKSVTVE